GRGWTAAARADSSRPICHRDAAGAAPLSSPEDNRVWLEERPVGGSCSLPEKASAAQHWRPQTSKFRDVAAFSPPWTYRPRQAPLPSFGRARPEGPRDRVEPV